MPNPRTTRYEAQDKKAGFSVAEIGTILQLHGAGARVRAETGFGGMKPGGPIKALIIEED